MNGFGDLARFGRGGGVPRLGGALKGMFGGVVLLVVAFGLQFWNEGRTQRRNALLDEGRSGVQIAEAANPSAAHEGRLVHVSGEATSATPVVDAEFGVGVPALALRRRVEMYQWHEKREQRSEKLPGGGERKVTEHRYALRWNDDLVRSSRFERASEHANPDAMPYRRETWRADTVRIGAFALAPALVDDIGGWERVPVEQVSLPPNLAASFRRHGDWYVTSEDPAKPAVGDVRVRFDRVPAGTLSVVARQQGDTLVPFENEEDMTLALVRRGVHAPDALFDAASTGNNRTGWILRAAGFIVAWVGFGLLLKPLALLAGAIPLVGRLAGAGSAIVSGLLAAMFSLLGIGGGWLWTRPWALAVVGIGVAALVALVVVRLQRRTPHRIATPGAVPPAAPAPTAVPPPPPPG
jgi:hypothetical protein